MNWCAPILLGLLAICTMGCVHGYPWLARRVEASPSYRRLLSQRPDAGWVTDYALDSYAVVAIGASADENLWHRWATLRVWRSGRVDRMV